VIYFVYDADGMMVQRSENGRTTSYLGKLFEHNTTLGSFTKHYLFGGKIVAVRGGLDGNSSASFLLTDHLGSTTATVFAGTGGLCQHRVRMSSFHRVKMSTFCHSTCPLAN
jgi:hypothetical protein